MRGTPAPSTVYAVVDTTNGSLKVGGGSSTKQQSQVHETYQGAARAISRMRYNPEKYVIYRYNLAAGQE